MIYEIKRIRIWSVVKTGFFVWGLIGFLFGLYAAAMMPILFEMMGSLGPFSSSFEGLSPLMLIFLPIFYSIMLAVVGTLITALSVGFFNLIASLLGGIEIDLKGDAIQPLEIPAEPPGEKPDDSNYSI